VVRDPHRLAGSVEWPEPVASDRVEAPTLAQLSELGSDFALVRDILQPRQDVGAMIDRFNSSGENDLFRMPPNGDVLRLFAPEGDVEPASALPGLTRREHQAAALDSHLRAAGLGKRAWRICPQPLSRPPGRGRKECIDPASGARAMIVDMPKRLGTPESRRASS
jgi:hypothetical protein